MRSLQYFLIIFTVLAQMIGCAGGGGGSNGPGPDPNPGPDPIASKLTISSAGSVTAPANVTLGFSVQDESGSPVLGLGVSNFTITEDGSPLSTSESNMTGFPAKMGYNLLTVMMLDLSGSITADTLTSMIQASKNMIDVLDPATTGQKIAIYYFQSDVVILQDFTSNAATLKAQLDTLPNYVMSGASTNLYGAFVEGLKKLSSYSTSTLGTADLTAGSLVVFTDGTDMANKYTYDAAKSAVDASQYNVFTVGLNTADLDAQVLTDLGKSGYYPASDVSALSDAFSTIATNIIADSSKYYVVVYCSAKRDANLHTATLVVTTSSGATGTATYQFSANNFTDGCYDQVEAEKLQYWDADGDNYYSVSGPLQDCDDSDPYNWVSCSTCIDADGDGYKGTGCDRAADLWDNDASKHPLNLTTVVSTLAGSAGVSGSTNGTGTAARFSAPDGIAVAGDVLYVADFNNNEIRKVVISSGSVTTFAGSTTSGSTNGAASVARFKNPAGVATDGVNLYVADTNNNMIRKINLADGTVSTLAGSTTSGSTDGVGTAARFNGPHGIATDGVNLYVTDTNNNMIRKITIADGTVTTLAGATMSGSADGIGPAAKFNNPRGIVTDGVNLYVADSQNYRIRKIVISDGTVTTLAGSGSGSSNGIGMAASFNYPEGIAFDGMNLFVTDFWNNSIRKIDILTTAVTTIAGSTVSGSADGTGTSAKFYHPEGITTDGISLYVVDYANNTIRIIK